MKLRPIYTEIKRRLSEQVMSLRQLEDCVSINRFDIRANMKTYRIKSVKTIRNYVDLASVLGLDSRIFKNVDLAEYTTVVDDILNQR